MNVLSMRVMTQMSSQVGCQVRRQAIRLHSAAVDTLKGVLSESSAGWFSPTPTWVGKTGSREIHVGVDERVCACE